MCSEDKNRTEYFVRPFQAYYTWAVFIIRIQVKQEIKLKKYCLENNCIFNDLLCIFSYNFNILFF